MYEPKRKFVPLILSQQEIDELNVEIAIMQSKPIGPLLYYRSIWM